MQLAAHATNELVDSLMPSSDGGSDIECIQRDSGFVMQ